jgi:hypothetical protein
MQEQDDSCPEPSKGRRPVEQSRAQKPPGGDTEVTNQTSGNKQQNTRFSAGPALQNRSPNPTSAISKMQTPTQAPEESEYLTVASRGKNVRKTTYLLVGLFVLGLICLCFMIKKSTPASASAAGGAEETQIELAISRLTGVSSEMFHRMDEIVRKFYEFSDVQQVSVNELLKNPFKHEMFLGDLEAGPNKRREMGDTDAETMKQQAGSMQLLSILASDNGNCCMIDDRVLYEGDTIRGFEVRQIGENAVKLQSQELEIVLKLSE